MDQARRDPEPAAELHPVGCLARPEAWFKERVELLAVLEPSAIGGEARVARELRQLDRVAQLGEHRVGADAHVELAVAPREHAVGREEREVSAELSGQRARACVVGDVVGDQMQRAVIERGLEVLPAP